jgi:hypothetical protein
VPHTLAERLDSLFATVVPAGRGPYSNAEVATATGLAASYIGYLRTGKRQNPTLQTLEVLARFFGVPVAYFYDDDAEQRIEAQLEQLRALSSLRQVLQREGVRDLAARMGGLSDGGIAAIGQLVDLLLDKQQPDQPRPGRKDADGGT